MRFLRFLLNLNFVTDASISCTFTWSIHVLWKSFRAEQTYHRVATGTPGQRTPHTEAICPHAIWKYLIQKFAGQGKFPEIFFLSTQWKPFSLVILKWKATLLKYDHLYWLSIVVRDKDGNKLCQWKCQLTMPSGIKGDNLFWLFPG